MAVFGWVRTKKYPVSLPGMPNALNFFPPSFGNEPILSTFAALRNGVKISFQFQANYFGVSQLSFEANSSAI